MLHQIIRNSKNAAIVLLTIISIFAINSNLKAQIDSTVTDTQINQLSDSLSVSNDSLSVENKDTTRLYEPLSKHGSLFLTSGDYYTRINKKDLLWMDYFGMYDIIRTSIPSYPLYQGGYFQYNQLTTFGTGHRNSSFRFNNRPINDANFGAYNIDMFPPDFVENIEILIGSDAVIFSNNSSGTLINFQEVKYNTATPYTKLWVNESGTTFIGSDGVFSQNIFKNINFTFGFRKLNSTDEYLNQWTDSWNLRGILRWNISDRTNISISESFYNHAMGTNGGINSELSNDIFNPREATPLYSDFNERVIRHDLTVTLSTYLDADTSSAFTLTGFLTTADWYRRVPGKIVGTDSIYNDEFLSNQYGLTGKYEQELTKFVSLKIGGDIIMSDVGESLFSESMSGLSLGGFGHIGFRPAEKLLISGGIRMNSQLNRFYNSIGGKIEYFADKSSSYFGDISISQRIPSPSEGLNLKNENHFLLIGGLIIKNADIGFNSSVFFRSVGNPITADIVKDLDGNIINTQSVQRNSLTSTGASVNFSSSIFKNIYYTLNGNISFDNWAETASFSSPRVFGGVDTYYRLSFGRSEIRFGLDINLVFQSSWLRYLPQKRQYTLTDQQDNLYNDGFKVYAHAKLGNAYFKVSVKNLIGTGYYFTAYYPAPGMIINLALNWAFLD